MSSHTNDTQQSVSMTPGMRLFGKLGHGTRLIIIAMMSFFAIATLAWSRLRLPGQDLSTTQAIQQTVSATEVSLFALFTIISTGYLLFMHYMISKSWLVRARLAAKQIARGNLDHRMADNTCGQTDDFALLGRSINAAACELERRVNHTVFSASEVHSAAEQLSTLAQRSADGSGKQMDSVSQIAAAMEEIASSIMQTSNQTNESESIAQVARENAVSGREVVEKTQSSMMIISESVNDACVMADDLGIKVREIESVLGVIKNISGQTNLLALNSAIEASRAGEYGRGFAVVADEVRNLASETVEATRQINTIIETVQLAVDKMLSSMDTIKEQVTSGSELSKDADEKLALINERNQQVLHLMHDLAASIREQSEATGNITHTTEHISMTTEANDALIDETSRIAQYMEQLSDGMLSNIKRRFID